MKKGFIGIGSWLLGISIGAVGVEKISKAKISKIKQLSDKHLKLFLMMNQWVRVRQEGKEISSYFVRNSYKRIAVYGMSYAGETLLEELKKTEIEVVYGIDQKADGIFADIKLVTMEEPLDNVDAVVVTAITFLDEIEEKLRKKIHCPIISLEDILYEI